MVLSFKYRYVPRKNNIKAKTPSIPVTLSNGKDTKFNFVSLLDSGADISAVTKETAELLNLDMTGKKEEAFGISGSVEAINSTMLIELSKGHQTFSYKIPVKIILSDKADFQPLIGRAGFFDKFTIIFKQSEERVELKPHSERRYN